MAGDSTSETAWSGRRPRLAVVVLWCAVGLVCAILALGALPIAFGDTDASASTEERLDSALDRTVGDTLQRYGAGGITGRTEIASVRPYTNPTDEVQFRVDAEEAAYWRTGAYDVYTGKQWHRSADYQPYEMDDPPGEQFRRSQTYTVEIEQPTTRVPAAWRPMNVDASGRKVTYDTQGGLQTDTLVQSGEVFRVESQPPESEPSRLRSASTAYPEPIEQRYTDLPDSVTDRVRERSAAVTADADNPYDSAVAVSEYLRSNKGYTLDVPPADSDVSDELLFEREAAHCAYFATTMVVMLRAQDIPARYAVGYTTGDRIDGEYVVRDANAHAWVEVFFPEVGWVSFDPTPADDRTGAVTDAVDGVDEGELRTTEEQQSDDNDDSTDDLPEVDPPNDDDSSDDDKQDGLTITTMAEPLPGESVTVVVREDGEPRSGTTVLFNGEPVGQTGGRGTVTATVPYAETLEITVRPPPTPVGSAGRQSTDRGTAIGQSTPENETFELPTTIDLSLDGQPLAGSETTVTARLAGVPVSDATIRRDGEAIGTTGRNGTLRVSLPDEPGTELELEAERDAATGSQTVTLADVTVAVDGEPLVLPSRSMTVTATANGTPVEGALVLVDGERVATADGTPVRTDANGTATVAAPSAFSAAVTVSGSDATTIRPLGNLLGLLLGGGLAVGLVVGVLRGRSFRRNDRSLSRWLIDRALVAADGLSSGDASSRGTFGSVFERLRGWLGSGGSDERSMSAVEVDGDDPVGAVRSAWIGLLTAVPGVSGTSTPRSIADRAIEFGFPRRAVERVLASFRALEYGGRTPTGDRDVEQLEEAVSDLHEEVNGRD